MGNDGLLHISLKKTDKLMKILGDLNLSATAATDRLWETVDSVEIIEEIKIKLTMPNGKKKVIKKRIIRESKNFATDIDG